MSDAALHSLHYHGTLLPSDTTTCISYPFDVDDRAASIRLRLAYTPYRVGSLRNLITLGLFDPKGFRGHAHRGPPDAEVIVSPGATTRGFVPGPLPAGRWLAQLYVHAILPTPEPCQFTFDIETLPGPGAPLSTPLPPIRQATTKGAAWYRGELHTHTVHSDGSCTVAELAANARQRGLDFIALTDHNTISGWADLGALPADAPLVIPSYELTSYHGHAVILHPDRWIDWRIGHNGWTINDAARAAHDAGGLFIIAHPSSPLTPICTGCRWEYDDIDMTLVDGMEAWSMLWTRESTNNPRNLRLWREQVIAQKHPVTAVAAADYHDPTHWSKDVPVTYVYAEELSINGILSGIKQGKVVLSTGPWIELSKTSTRGTLLDERTAGGPQQTNVLAIWRDAPPGARLRWLNGNALLGEMAVGDQGRAGLLAPRGRVHLELWSSSGILLALTNPVSIV